ncbi:BnaA09g46070D [Brassica napus]|uniref:BnaA09g46070D protein n=1 Tax=Brassica napus TaxID=3708 RepID=A0A078H7F2_BRANA|nr:BnaA09g46070D [Brassica napus]
MKKVFLNIVLLSFLLGVAFPSQLRNTKTSTPKMKKMFLNFVLLSFLLGVAFHLANGADVNHQGQCDSDLECYTMRSCQRGPGYCDQKDGKCKCPKLQLWIQMERT